MGGRLLRSLSLFSGIGGLDLSLKGVLKPLVYCEIDPYALAVLNDQMRKGTLLKAVVNTDVRTLTSAYQCQGGGDSRSLSGRLAVPWSLWSRETTEF